MSESPSVIKIVQNDDQLVRLYSMDLPLNGHAGHNTFKSTFTMKGDKPIHSGDELPGILGVLWYKLCIAGAQYIFMSRNIFGEVTCEVRFATGSKEERAMQVAEIMSSFLGEEIGVE